MSPGGTRPLTSPSLKVKTFNFSASLCPPSLSLSPCCHLLLLLLPQSSAAEARRREERHVGELRTEYFTTCLLTRGAQPGTDR